MALCVLPEGRPIGVGVEPREDCVAKRHQDADEIKCPAAIYVLHQPALPLAVFDVLAVVDVGVFAVSEPFPSGLHGLVAYSSREPLRK